MQGRGAKHTSSGEVNPTHLPRCHLAIVAQVGVAVLLDRDQRCIGPKPHRGLQTLLRVLTPKARRQRQIARLVVLVRRDVAGTVDGPLVAEQVELAGVVLVEPNPDAGRRVAVTPGIHEPHVGNGPLIGNSVLALAVWAVGARPSAGGARGRGVEGPVGVPCDLLRLALAEGRDDLQGGKACRSEL